MNSLNGLRVLIVEDQPTQAEELKQAFVAAGANVCIETCKGALSSPAADLAAVVLDWLPATVARRDFIRLLRQQKIPYVFYCDPPPTHAIAALGATFVEKPSDPSDVVAAVIEAVRRHGAA